MRITNFASLTTPLLITATLSAGIGPFTETFDDSSANWVNAPGTAFLDHFENGGPMGAGDGYASGAFNFANTTAETDIVVHRAQDEFNASGNAFVGDYITAGINQLSFDIRHDLPTPANVFVRFASPVNFPGGIAVEFAPILSNQWTNVTIPIDPGNPQFVSFEGTSFAAVFSNVGHLQIGVRTPQAVAGVDSDFNFDIDNVSIIPAPGAAAAFATGALALTRRRRS